MGQIACGSLAKLTVNYVTSLQSDSRVTYYTVYTTLFHHHHHFIFITAGLDERGVGYMRQHGVVTMTAGTGWGWGNFFFKSAVLGRGLR